MAKELSFLTPRVISALVLREMSTTYGRSAGGYLWAIAEPVAGIVLLTLVFGIIARSPPLGTSFPLFYATGLLPFMMYMTVSMKIAQSIMFSRALLVYPRVTFFDAIVARFILTALTQLLVFYIVLASILFMSDTRTVLDFQALGLAIVLSLSLAFGVGAFNCLLFAVFPTWRQVWAVLNRPAFLVSGVFFLFEGLPERFATYLWYNPLVHVVGQMRKGVYSTYSGDYVSVSYVMIWAVVTTTIGLFFLRRYHKKILNEL